MNIPNNPKHKPIAVVDNYNNIDGHYCSTQTDAESLSIGYAQFDHYNPNELAVKVFRYNAQNNRWSRQSEELPLHRCVDLCNLLVQSIMMAEGVKYSPVQTQIQPQIEDINGLVDIKNYYERVCQSDPNRTHNQLREKLRELRILIDVLNP